MVHRCNHCQRDCNGIRESRPLSRPDLALLLKTNNAPTEAQENAARQLRLDGRERLAELDSMIDGAQRALDSLVQERDDLQWRLDVNKLVLNPVRRLPPDILREIFLYAVAATYPQVSTHMPPTSSISGVGPGGLTAVCRLWFDTATTSPELWCHIHLHLYQHPSNVSRSSHGLMQHEYLFSRIKASAMSSRIAWSAQRPLILSLSLETSSPPYSNAHNLHTLLLQCAPRIRRLCIRLPTVDGMSSPEFRRLASQMINLDTLEIHTAFQATPASLSTMSFSFPSTLKHITIPSHFGFLTAGVYFNWEMVERAELQLFRPAEFLAALPILTRMRNLRSLVLWNNHDPWRSPHYTPTNSDLTMHKLEHLTVEDPSNDSAQVFERLTVPQLQTLVVVGANVRVVSALRELVRRSKPKLRGIALSFDGNASHDSFILFYIVLMSQEYSSIQELSIFTPGIDAGRIPDLFIRPLVFTQKQRSKNVGLPLLRRLVLDLSAVDGGGLEDSSPIAEAVLDVLESRRPARDQGVALLDTLVLHVRTDFALTHEQKDRLEAIKESGVHVHIMRYDETDRRPSVGI